MRTLHALTLTAIAIVCASLATVPRPAAANPLKFTLRSLQLQSGENNFFSNVVDSVNGFVYFGTNTNPCRIVKVRLADFSHFDTLTIPSSTGCGLLSTAAIDSTASYAYFGLGNINSGSIFKIDLSTFSLADTLRLSSGQPFSSVVVGDYLYVGTPPGSGTSDQGEIHKIDLVSFTEIGILSLDHGDRSPASVAVDQQSQVAFFGVTPSSVVVKVDLQTFAISDSVQITASQSANLRTLVFDPVAGHIYAGLDSDILEIDGVSMAIVGTLKKTPQLRDGIASLAIDPSRRVLFASYFGRSGACSGTEVAAFDLQDSGRDLIRKITASGLGPLSVDASTGAAYVGDIYCQQLTTPGNIFRIAPNP